MTEQATTEKRVDTTTYVGDKDMPIPGMKDNRKAKAADDFFDSKHYFSDGLYAKQFVMPAGTAIGQHKHNYKHLSVLAKGKVLLTVEGQTSELTGPAMLELAAGRRHHIFALEDAVWYCIHATEATCMDEMKETPLIMQEDI